MPVCNLISGSGSAGPLGGRGRRQTCKSSPREALGPGPGHQAVMFLRLIILHMKITSVLSCLWALSAVACTTAFTPSFSTKTIQLRGFRPAFGLQMMASVPAKTKKSLAKPASFAHPHPVSVYFVPSSTCFFFALLLECLFQCTCHFRLIISS
jgi:hypothetical protein